VNKTGRLIVVESAWRMAGFAAEIIASITENIFGILKSAPTRLTLPDCPTPTSPALARHYYPRAIHIVNAVRNTLGLDERTEEELDMKHDIPLDVPDQDFKGPF
jgi:acetoin:2,6-dichlorophenolindophenol oxidoreductase subunit beta